MKEKRKELMYAIAKGGISSVPLVGGVLSELFTVAFSDPATKRREQILLDMNERLRKLEKDGFDVSILAGSDEFLTIAMQVYNYSLRTHQMIKRQALMNALSNTPKLSIDENIMLMYLTYIDDFNEWHLKILAFLDNPSAFFDSNKKPNYYMAGKSTLLIKAFPELATKRPFYDRGN